MGRIRTVKPELFTHEELFRLECETGLPLRIAFVGLFTICDREGRFKWQPNVLKLAVLPFDQCDFSRVLDALMTRDMVRQYRVDGKFFGVIPTFSKHQVINNRESASDLPEPNENSYLDATSTREARVADASGTPLVQDQGEGKGREGKGREGNNNTSSSEATALAVVIPYAAKPNPAVEQRSTNARVAQEDIERVFEYWRERRNHPRAQMDDKRCKAIRGRLKDGYTVADLCAAVDGIAHSRFHMGENEHSTIHDDIELICRTGPHVDRFRAMGVQPALAPKMQRQVDILKDWMAEGEAQ